MASYRASAADVDLRAPSIELDRAYFRYLVVFDITQSMNVRDAAVNSTPATRLGAAKNAAHEAVTRMPCGTHVGLGVFTEHRTLPMFTPVEICAHRDEIVTAISDIHWRLAWRAKSEIAKGLHSGLRLAAGLEQPARLVLFTDGHEAPPIHPRYTPQYDGDPPAASSSAWVVPCPGQYPDSTARENLPALGLLTK